MKNSVKVLIFIALATLLAGPLPVAMSAEPAPAVSGRLAGGLRLQHHDEQAFHQPVGNCPEQEDSPAAAGG